MIENKYTPVEHILVDIMPRGKHRIKIILEILIEEKNKVQTPYFSQALHF